MLLPIYNQKGISLVELLITLLLSLFMLTGVVQIFSSNSHSYRFSKAFSSLQENGRVALDEIARDIRMAGYLGCASRQQITVNSIANDFAPDLSPENHLIGFDSSIGSPLISKRSQLKDYLSRPLILCDSVLGNTESCRQSDVIQIIKTSETIAVTTTTQPTNNSPITISSSEMLELRPTPTIGGNSETEEDLFLITDCRNADLFRASNISANSITPNGNLQQQYSNGSFLAPLSGVLYFLARDDKDRDNDGSSDPIANLYRIGLFDNDVVPLATPIARGVESLQFQYGEDTQGDEFADIYRNSAADVTDFTRVVSIRVGILMKSDVDFLTDNPLPVSFLGDTFTSSDRRLRLQFFTTVGLRNRVP